MAYFSATEAYELITEYPLSQAARTLCSNAGISVYTPEASKKNKLRSLLRTVRAGARERTAFTRHTNGNELYIGKWLRPWDVASSLRNLRAPHGEHLIGIEIELGFTSMAAAQRMATKVINWRHITLDFEGGDYPIELTFPPILRRKLTAKSQVGRYLKLLNAEDSGVFPHHPNRMVGTHVNVSRGDISSIDTYRVREVGLVLSQLGSAAKARYFGRQMPYDYMYLQRDASGMPFIEFKLFNSTTNWKEVKRYVNVATALYDLVVSAEHITEQRVNDALSSAHRKRV